MLPDPVSGVISGAKNTLDKANKITENPHGNPVPLMEPLEFSKASYSMIPKMRKKKSTVQGINSAIS